MYFFQLTGLDHVTCFTCQHTCLYWHHFASSLPPPFYHRLHTIHDCPLAAYYHLSHLHDMSKHETTQPGRRPLQQHERKATTLGRKWDRHERGGGNGYGGGNGRACEVCPPFFKFLFYLLTPCNITRYPSCRRI